VLVAFPEFFIEKFKALLLGLGTILREFSEDARGLLQPALKTTNLSVKEPSHGPQRFGVRGVLDIEHVPIIDGTQLMLRHSQQEEACL
jgi:hypothetical protein